MVNKTLEPKSSAMELNSTFGLEDDSPPANFDPRARAIDRLVPKGELHQKVLDHLLTRIDFSEFKMQDFYSRWNFNERRVQAYIDLPDYEKLLKDSNDRGAPPKVVHITVPYMYATISTIVTYMIHTFAGRKPIFQVGSLNAEGVMAAQSMEMIIQYNADHTRLIRHLFQYFWDQETYGVGVLLVDWARETNRRTVWTASPQQPDQFVSGKKDKVTYEGNVVRAIDPYMFFPDPRVPMTECGQRGEFVFWRSFEGQHMLKRMEAAGQVKWVDEKYIGTMPTSQGLNSLNEKSDRNLRSGGVAHPGQSRDYGRSLPKDFAQIDQGTCEIIPKDLGLADVETPQKWIFTIANRRQIIQAEPFDRDHGRHPVSVCEPYTMGYGFGQLGSADYIGPLQDTISWFVNSHIENVRTAINNMFIYDPSRVETQDVNNPGPGKLMRLKRAAYGQDVRTAIQQFQVVDVTRGHVQDLEMFLRLADTLTGITDNLRGLQDAGGRKTATEVRTASEAAASRLAASARLRSAQGIVELTEMMSLNVQQLMSQEFVYQVLGTQAAKEPIRIRPEHLTGDFYFPVHDGTLPIDRVAMLDVWKEIFLTVAQSPPLSQRFDVMGLFDYVAELGGAKNLDKFKVQVNMGDPNQMAQNAQAGNAVPLQNAPIPPRPAQTGAVQQPGRRLAGGQ